MPYGRRRYGRRRKATIPGTIRSVRRGATDNNPRFAYQRGACKRLVHLHPSSADASMRFTNSLPWVVAGGSAGNQNAQILNGIGQDVGVNFRLNNRIFMRYLMIRGYSSGGDGDEVIRMGLRLMVVYVPISRGITLSAIDVLAPVSTTGFRPDEHKDGAQVLYDEAWNVMPSYVWNGAANPAGTPPGLIEFWPSNSSNRMFQLKIPVFRSASYTGVGASYTDIETGQLWLCTISDAPGGATTVPRFFFNWKLSFIDSE